MKQKLIREYSKHFKDSNKSGCLKYIVYFNDVTANLYFDMWDVENPSLSLILVYNKIYYFTSIYIGSKDIPTQFLTGIPSEILCKIEDSNKKLETFFNAINEYILNNNCYVTSYNKDTIFKNTLKYQKQKENLPFIHYIARKNMTQATFDNLRCTFGIDEKILKDIQKRGFTIVRTDDFTKRITLKTALGKIK